MDPGDAFDASAREKILKHFIKYDNVLFQSLYLKLSWKVKMSPDSGLTLLLTWA